jgi:hypothetical protein
MVYSQIWLNLLVDDFQFGYITKLEKRKRKKKKKKASEVVRASSAVLS